MTSSVTLSLLASEQDELSSRPLMPSKLLPEHLRVAYMFAVLDFPSDLSFRRQNAEYESIIAHYRDSDHGHLDYDREGFHILEEKQDTHKPTKSGV